MVFINGGKVPALIGKKDTADADCNSLQERNCKPVKSHRWCPAPPRHPAIRNLAFRKSTISLIIYGGFARKVTTNPGLQHKPWKLCTLSENPNNGQTEHANLCQLHQDSRKWHFLCIHENCSNPGNCNACLGAKLLAASIVVPFN